MTIEDAPALILIPAMTLEAWVYPTGAVDGWHTVLLKEQPGELMYSLYMHDAAHMPVTSVFIEGEQMLEH